ncbi:hypothetical protein FBQ82_00295 [Anaerolineae bacterium CFX7]|nr:hypothetical protein [Anaerolineae bacterium CFX7]
MSHSDKERLKRQHQAERNKQRKQIFRLSAFGILLLLVIFAVGYFLAPVFAPKASGVTQVGSGKIINIQAAMDGFDIPEIRAKVGEQISVNLTSLDNSMHSDGGGKHQFAIDELGVNLVAQPLSSNSTTFTATKPGVYTFYCDICCGGKANPTMNGKLVIEA